MKKNKLKMIENWLSTFPCKSYFNESACILEFADKYFIKEIKKLIDEQYHLYKHGDEINDWAKNHIS